MDAMLCTILILKLEKVELIVICALQGIKSYNTTFMFCDLLHLQCNYSRHIHLHICELKILAENLAWTWLKCPVV